MSVRRFIHAALPPVAVVGLLLLAWEAVDLIVQPSEYLFPGPGAVVRAMLEHWRTLASAAAMTGLSALAGFAIAATAGVVAGSLLATNRFLMRGLYPIATLLQMVPLVAVAPLLVIWFGFGAPTVIASAAIVSLFPVLASTLDGMRGTDRGLGEMFRIYGATRTQRWWKLELPWAIPSIVTGLRIAAGLAVIGAIVGEFVGAFAGSQMPLGLVILSAMRENRTDLVFAAVALAASVGFALFALVSTAGWLAVRRWHASAE